MTTTHIQAQFVRASRLQAAPVAAEAALRVLSIGELDASTLALVIGADSVLTAAVVRATEPCDADTSIAQRIASLSPARLHSALFPVLSDAITEGSSRGGQDRGWNQTLATAIAAESIARALGTVSPDQAYLLGLMQHFESQPDRGSDTTWESPRTIARAFRFPEWLRDCLVEDSAGADEKLVEVVELAKMFALGTSREECARHPIGTALGLTEQALLAAHADFTASYERRLTLFAFSPAQASELRASLMRFANQLLLNWRVDESAAKTARERATQLELLHRFNEAARNASHPEEIALLCAETLRSALGANAGMLSVWGRRSTSPRGVMWHGRTSPLESLPIPDGYSGVQAIQQILSDPLWQTLEVTAPCALPVRTPSNRLTGYVAIATPAGSSADWLARLDEWTRALGAAIESAEEHERQRLHNEALKRALEVRQEAEQPVTPEPAADRDAVEAGQRNLARAVVSALQSPLSAITTQTGQLTSQTGRATDAALISDIAKHARAAARVLNDVQALTHGGGGNCELILINAPLRQFLNLVRPRLTRRSIQLEERLAEGLPRVRLDARKLHHVLLNLFAFIESRLGHSSRRIVVSSAVTDDREGVSITIDVDGLALTDAQAETLFTPLETVGESASEHALLRAACGALVRDAGGLITACTHASGATFMLAFESVSGNSATEPLHVAAPSPPPTPIVRETERAHRHVSRILVVDDDDGVREILAQALRKAGYAADLARDGEEALRAIDEKSYDLVLLDMLMPNRNGLAVLRELRKKADAPKAIVMTGSTAAEARDEAAALGAHNFLQKPFELRKLLAEVESVLLHRVG